MSVLFGTFRSESGAFAHVGGIVFSFVPASDNVIPGGIDAPGVRGDEIRHYDNAVKTLIVPDGVKGFADGFLEEWAVTDSVVFPDSLESIGTLDGEGCAFACCFLPEIVLPSSLKVIGTYAFGGSRIRRLVVDPANRSKYARQFKDSAIDELLLPKESLEARHTASAEEYGFIGNFYAHCRCRIIEY